MRFIDVTLPIAPGMPVYPGDPAVAITPWSSITDEAEFNVSALQLGSHTGTHVDAPSHCFTGAPSVDTLPPEVLCGPAHVLDAQSDGRGGSGQTVSVPELPPGCTRLLLRTRGREGWTVRKEIEGPGLDEDTASRLIDHGVRLVGIDRLSIAAGTATLPVHRLLLAAGIVILEGLDLREAPPGRYGLLCLPLKVAGCDGAPARVLLTSE